jgi:hypothetical protein
MIDRLVLDFLSDKVCPKQGRVAMPLGHFQEIAEVLEIGFFSGGYEQCGMGKGPDQAAPPGMIQMVVRDESKIRLLG